MISIGSSILTTLVFLVITVVPLYLFIMHIIRSNIRYYFEQKKKFDSEKK